MVFNCLFCKTYKPTDVPSVTCHAGGSVFGLVSINKCEAACDERPVGVFMTHRTQKVSTSRISLFLDELSSVAFLSLFHISVSLIG